MSWAVAPPMSPLRRLGILGWVLRLRRLRRLRRLHVGLLRNLWFRAHVGDGAEAHCHHAQQQRDYAHEFRAVGGPADGLGFKVRLQHWRFPVSCSFENRRRVFLVANTVGNHRRARKQTDHCYHREYEFHALSVRRLPDAFNRMGSESARDRLTAQFPRAGTSADRALCRAKGNV